MKRKLVTILIGCMALGYDEAVDAATVGEQ